MLQVLNVGKIKTQAFTLIEVIMVVIISAILITVAIPGYQVIMRNTETLTIAARLESSLRKAQGQAIKLGIPISICPISASFNPQTSNDLSTTYNCLNTNAWNAWKIFSDPNFNGQEDPTHGSTVIEYVGDIQPDAITSNIAGPITFDPMGFANINPASSRSGWTWNNTYNNGEWTWSYNYGSSNSSTYTRYFSIIPPGCTGNNALLITITQNGVISKHKIAC